MRKFIKTLDATPPKEIFRSIIADYNIKLGICELIDNAIDIWTKAEEQDHLAVKVNLDLAQQKITVTDNAGGMDEEHILFFISPGRTGNVGNEETIGIFGVGSKRAVIALAENVKMTTRRHHFRTCQIAFDEQWLDQDKWDIDLQEVDEISPNTTIIELLGLRNQLSKDTVSLVQEHVNSTYAYFLLKKNITIEINGVKAFPTYFDKAWSYPPDYAPREYIFNLPVEERSVSVQITGGLVRSGSSDGGESGVYFYCNKRQIARAIKDFEVGFMPGKAGLASHPSTSLVRVIVKLSGHPSLMPWNSSKSQINYQHKVYEAIRDSLIHVVIYYVKLSRRFMGDYPNNVYQYDEGSVETSEIESPADVTNLYDIPLPRVRKSYTEKVEDKNKTLAKKKPFVVGHYESIVAVDSLFHSHLKQKNRLCLILLDSDIEIALKDYLVYVKKIGIDKFESIKKKRNLVISEVKSHAPGITDEEWDLVEYYYKMRNNLIHQMNTADVRNEDVENYRGVTESILSKLFKLEF